MRFPFVLLDAGGTILGPRESWGSVYARVLRGLGFVRTAETFDRAIRWAWDDLGREIPRGVDRYGFFEGGEDAYWHHFAKKAIEGAAGDEPTDGLAEDALPLLREAFREPSAWSVFPDVRPALAELARAGARLAIVSNWDSRLPNLLEVLDLDGFFGGIAVSHLLGFEKPDPRIFASALAMIGGDRHRAIHVGDVPELDFEGARDAGLSALLIDRHGRLDPAFRPLPDLAGLPAIVLDGLP